MIFCGIGRGLAAAPFVKRRRSRPDYPDQVGALDRRLSCRAATTDILARLIGALSVGEDRPAVHHREQGRRRQQLATEAVLTRPPDGYNVLLVNPANGINATLYKKLKFNFVRDIAPVGGIMRVPNVMVVNNDVPAKTVKEFIDYAKANPGKVNMASSGNGTSVHHVRRTVHGDDRREDDPRAVSRLEPGADRHAWAASAR